MILRLPAWRALPSDLLRLGIKNCRPVCHRTLPATATPTASVEKVEAKVSPKARRMAQELGVDLSKLTGTGPGGTISGEDVQRAADSQKSAPQKSSAQPSAPQAVPTALSSIARLMAERTTQSWTTAPHFFLVREIDASGLIAAREKHGKAITHTDLLVALVARVLVKHPKMNASWTGSAIQANPNVNTGIAIAVKDGVVGAVIPNADKAMLDGHQREAARSGRARSRRPPSSTRCYRRYVYRQRSRDVRH